MSVSDRIRRLESQSSVDSPNLLSPRSPAQKSPAVSPVAGRHPGCGDRLMVITPVRDSESTMDLTQLIGPPDVEPKEQKKDRPPLPKKPTSFSGEFNALQLDNIQRPTLNPSFRAKTTNNPPVDIDDQGPIILVDNEHARESGNTLLSTGPRFSDIVDDQPSPRFADESAQEPKGRRDSLQKLGDNVCRLSRSRSDNMVTKWNPKPISPKLVGAKLSQTFDPVFKDVMSGGKKAFDATKPVRDSVSQTYKEAGDATKLAMTETGISKASMMVADDATDAAAKATGKEGLCSKCQRIPINKYIPSNAGTSDNVLEWATPLSRVIYHSEWCRICRLLLDMLCRPDNDPLYHPAVAPYVQQELKGSDMRDWTSTGWAYTDRYWPFGHGSRRNEGATYVLGPGKKALAQIMHFAAEFAMTKGRSNSKRLANALTNYSTHSNLVNVMASARHPLSCVLKISTEARPGHMSSGNLFVNLFGYGRKLGADLQVLSSFRLKAVGPGLLNAGDVSPTPQFDSSGKFSYGNLLDENWIDPDMCRLWLQACEIGHGPECSQHGWDLAMQKPKFLRIIDVNELCVKVAPNPAQCRFVALSYVWGGAGMMKFQISNMEELMRPGSLTMYLKDLPKTVVDAIEIVRGMGEKFLWVDALCILQGDTVETTENIRSMDSVYGNAIATIVAGQGNSANAGLCGVKSRYLPELAENPARQRHLHQRSAVVKDSMSLVAPLTTRDHDLDISEWNKRAWTFQERLLSRRLIVFTHGQMIWHCRKMICREDMSVEDSGIPYKPLEWLSLKPRYLGVDTGTTWIDGSTETTRHGSTRVVRSATFGEYAKMIEQYTHRHMSYQSDALNAAAGLLHIFSLCFKCSNLYGLPETNLDIALLWRPAQPLERRQGFPSWSWAGWKGRVAYDEPFKIDRTKDGRFVCFTLDSSGEEGIRPILRWHTARSGKAVPLNGTGLGIPFDGAVMPREWENGPYCMDSSGHGSIVQPPDIRTTPRGVDLSHCLIFWTSTASAKIRLGQAIVQNSDRKWNPAYPPKRFKLVDEDRYVVGNVLLDTADQKWMDVGRYEFVQLAEAQYSGCDDEERDVEDCPYYVVMLVEWDAGGQIAERRGLGRVHKAAWMMVGPKLKMVCLA